MKPSEKFNRINQNKFKKYLVFHIGIFLCMYRSGISAGATCGRPGNTKMNIFEPNGHEFNVNAKIRYNCTENNHIIVGNSERRCLRNGSWSDDIPVCSKMATIQGVQLLFQGSESKDQGGNTVDGDISTCSEASMYNRTIWRGHLSASMNISAVRVSYIGRADADIDVQILGENSYGAKCTIKPDDEGFLVKSIKTVTFYCPAVTVGKYIHVSCNSPLTFCEVSVLHAPDSPCFRPDVPLHGTGFKTISNEENFRFKCDEGYKHWGSLYVTCQTDGTWSPKSPICEEIYCHPPEDIENGKVEYNETKGKILYNGTAIFSCNEGFYLSGKSVIRCYKWQEWDSSPPVCKLKITENVDVAKTLPQTERWRQNNVTRCGNLPQIANGVLIVNSSHVGSIAWLKCAEGFRPLTHDRIYCLPSGEWSLHSLHCTIIQCEENPVIPFGKGILLNNSTYYGSYLQIKCNEGYVSDTITRTCDEHGSWGDLNICVEITCGTFNTKDPNNGQWIPVNGSSYLYVLTCPDSFHIEGSPAVIRCLPNGSWSYTSAKCQRSFTSFWGSNWTPSLVLIAAVAAGVATAIVILCLSVAFLVLKKRREAQTNTTVFHLEDTAQKERIREMNSQRQKHHSAAENYNTVELRCKSVCTFPRKPRSALPNLPVDADPVYAQPFETVTTIKKTSAISVNKKDDLYNTHIYAEPVDSKRNTPNHILVNTESLRMGTDQTLSNTRTNLENNLPSSVQTDQQNCDKKCAIYDSSGNAGFNSIKVPKEEVLQCNNGKNELGTLKKNLEYMELL